MTRRQRFDPLAIVSKIANQEKALIDTAFVAPYVGSGKVRLRLEGIIYELEVENCPEGWSIMQVAGAGKARFVQRAPLSMVQAYMRLIPRLQMVMIDRLEGNWWGLSANSGTQKIQLNGPVPILLTGTASSFDTVYCRFDGASFWFESVDRRRDPSIARHLRKSLADDVSPAEIRCRGMVPAENLAYKMLWLEKHRGEPATEEDDATRISRALEHAGARLDTFWYTNNGEQTSVRFVVDGQSHVVQIRSTDHSVLSAGICLSGQDQNFDLSSLVGVLREAHGSYFFD